MKTWWKSLSLQMLPWCFQMSMPTSHPNPSTPKNSFDEPEPPRKKPSPEAAAAAAVRLVGSDGGVRVYRRAVTASELMQEHPRHLVCRSDAFLIGQKIPALGPGEQLQPGHTYFLLPAHLFHSVLSFVSLASSLLLLLHDNSNKSAATAAKPRPFEIQKTASGTLQIKVCDEFLIDQVKDDDDVEQDGTGKNNRVLCGDDRLEKEYEELVGYGKSRRWKPKLETVAEFSGNDVDGDGGGSSRRSRTGNGGGRSLPLLGRLGSRRLIKDRSIN